MLIICCGMSVILANNSNIKSTSNQIIRANQPVSTNNNTTKIAYQQPSISTSTNAYTATKIKTSTKQPSKYTHRRHWHTGHWFKKQKKGNMNLCNAGQTYQNDEFCYDNDTLRCFSTRQSDDQQDSYKGTDCAPCGFFNSGDTPNNSCCKNGQFAVEVNDNIKCIDHDNFTCYNAKNENGDQSSYEPMNGICSHSWKCQQSAFQDDPSCQCHGHQENIGKFCLERETNICYSHITRENTDSVAYGISPGNQRPISTESETGRQKIYRDKECGPCGFYGERGAPNQACCMQGQRAYIVSGKLFCVDTENNNQCLSIRDASRPNQHQSTFEDDICACDASDNYQYPKSNCPPCKNDQKTLYNSNRVYCEDNKGNCYESLTSLKKGAEQGITNTPNACKPCGRDNCCPINQIKVAASDGSHFCLEKTEQNGDNNQTMYRCKTYTSSSEQTDYRRGACAPCGYVDQDGQQSNCPSCDDDERVEIIKAQAIKICVNKQTSICRPVIDYAHLTNIRIKYAPSNTRSECGLCGLWDNARCSDQYCYEPEQEKKTIGSETFCVNRTDHRCYTTVGNGKSRQDGFHKDACNQCGKYPDTECEDRCLTGQKQTQSDNGSICVVETATSTYEKGECLSLLDDNGKQARQRPMSGTCSLCGKFNIADCAPDTCKVNQKKETVNGIALCIDENTNICYNTIGGGIDTQVMMKSAPCNQCGKYPVTKCSNRCPKGQQEIQTENGIICVVNTAFNDYEKGDCLTLLDSNNQQSRHKPTSGACSLCGKYDNKDCPENTCLNHQDRIRKSGETVCVDHYNRQCTNTIGGGIGEQREYKEGICKQCGRYPDTYCTNRCPSGQRERALPGGSICVDNNTSDCLTLLDAAGQQRIYKPTHGQCALCGKWEISQCTEQLCLSPQQRLTSVSEDTFCVDQSTYECTNTVGRGVSKQSIKREKSCMQCGKYPDTHCENRCPEGQTERKVEGRSICIVSQFGHSGFSPKTCLTLLDAKGKQRMYQPQQGKCSLCGKFDDLDCAGCDAGQKARRDKQTGKQYCISMDGHCFKPLSGDGERQMPYKEGDCFNCGMTACCPSGTPSPTQNPAFCLNKNACYTLLNQSRSNKSVPYQKPPCGSCGLYPPSLCKTCPAGQTPNHDYMTGTSYCVNESNGQCYTNIDPKTNLQTAYKRSSNVEQPCYQCGKMLDRCDAQCDTNQTEQHVNGILTFCTDKENKCWTLLGNGATKQSAYQGPLCSGCGPYLRNACPHAVCLPNQTAQYQSGQLVFCLDEKNICYQPIGLGKGKQQVYQGPECTGCGSKLLSACEKVVCPSSQIEKSHDGDKYCVEAGSNQCLTSIGNGIARQNQVIGINDSHPCYPNGQYCESDSLSLECQARSETS